MKKYFKTLVTFGLIMIMIVSSLPVYAATNTEIKIDELEVTLEQLEDGITVIISLDKNNNKVQTVVTYDMMGNETISTKIIEEGKEISNSQDLKSVGDGVDTGNDTTVRVGFSNIKVYSTAGEVVSLGSGSSLVSR